MRLKGISRHQGKPHQAAIPVNQSHQFCVQAALGQTDGLHLAGPLGIAPAAAGASAVLMHFDEGPVHHHDPQVAFLGQRQEQLKKNPPVAPTLECAVHAVPLAEVRWQIPPRGTRSEYPDDALQRSTVVFGSTTRVAAFPGQEPHHPTPLPI